MLSFPASLVARGGRGQGKDIQGTLRDCRLGEARPWDQWVRALSISTTHDPQRFPLLQGASESHRHASPGCPAPAQVLFHISPRSPCALRLKNKATTNRLQREQLLANYLIRLLSTFHLQVKTCSLQTGHIQHALVNENKK